MWQHCVDWTFGRTRRRRRAAERTFGWLIRNRDLVRDFEGLVDVSATMVKLAMIGVVPKQLQIRNLQEDAAAAQQIMTNDIAGQKARATAKDVASDAGVSSLSAEALLADFHRQQSDYDTSVRINREWSQTQLGQDMKGAEAQAQGCISAVRPYVAPPINSPDYLATALETAGNVYQIGSKADLWKKTSSGP